MARAVKKSSKPSDEVKVVRHRRPEDQTVYSDSTYVHSGFFGFHFSFGVQFGKPDPQNESIPVYEYAHVGMSPEHAQRFHQILGDQLRDYEKRFGPIRQNPEQKQS